MIKTFQYVLCLVFVWWFNHQGLAQDTKTDKTVQNFPLSVALINQSWAFPGSQVFRLTPVYPGLSVGSEYHYRQRPKTTFYQSLEFGGFLNRSAGSALYGHTNIGWRYRADFGLAVDVSLGLGYFHGFHPSPIYSLNTNGTYEKVSDPGVGASAANIHLQLGYRLGKFNRDWTPFVSYQWMASTYYWSLITIRPSGFLKIGARFNLKTI